MLNLIVNPNARHGKNRVMLEKVEEKLKAWGGEYRILKTEKKGDASEYARKYSAEGDRFFVAMGGDGTMNEVLQGLTCPDECTFGLIPAGTGNDFAATAKIPLGLDALDLILSSEPKPTDYIQFNNGHRSLNIAGMGIDVDVLVRCDNMKHFHAKTKYALSLLNAVLKYPGINITYVENGVEVSKKVMIASLCNGKQFGGGIPFCPCAEIDDGMMEIVIVDFPKRSKILGALLKLNAGKLLSASITHHLHVSEITLRPEGKTYTQYDGEYVEETDLSAKVVSGKLKVFRG